MKKIICISLIAITWGCETTVSPDLDTAEEIMVVDAWLNQKMERQEIKITRSQPYFEHSEPKKITDATVTVEDLTTGLAYDFREGPTSYFWDPIDVAFGVVGHQYRLTVTAKGETFEAYSTLGRVPPIDSIQFQYNADDIVVNEPYYTAEFLATDPVGVGDAYWIKAWKNGNFLGKPGEVNMAFDAGFSAGQSVDGQVFILPIRRDFVNPLDESPGKNNGFLPPYLVGDSIYVEIHSLDPAAYEFLYGVYLQINRPGGFAELFSTPLANATTNVKNINENSTTNVAGFFNVASVSAKGQKLTPELAEIARNSQ